MGSSKKVCPKRVFHERLFQKRCLFQKILGAVKETLPKESYLSATSRYKIAEYREETHRRWCNMAHR